MKKIITHRGFGKTYQLIKESSVTGNYIVCHNMNAASEVMSDAKRYGFSIPMPITHDEFIERRYSGRNINGFLIDNVEMLLDRLSPMVPIKTITLTQD